MKPRSQNLSSFRQLSFKKNRNKPANTIYWFLGFFHRAPPLLWKNENKSCLKAQVSEVSETFKPSKLKKCQLSIPLLICTWFLKNQFGKTKLDGHRTGFFVYFELNFYCLCSLQKSILKLIFADYTGSWSAVQNRLKFVKLDFF